MTRHTDDPLAVVETRVVHDTHRRATSLLAGAAGAAAPHEALVTLRDFVVATLRHHHESEDNDLWPMLTAAAPPLADQLAELSKEHERLDLALDRLAADASPSSAAEVRDLMHGHLDREEPILLPALRCHLSDDDWAAFSQRAVASAPRDGTHLLVAFFHEVAREEDVALLLRHLPPEAMELVPAMRAEADVTLDALRHAAR